MLFYWYTGERLTAAQQEIEECKVELSKAKQIRRNKQGTTYLLPAYYPYY